MPIEADLDVELALDEVDVAARGLGKRGDVVHLVERLLPARKRLVDRLAVMEIALVGGELLGLAPVAQPVAHADRQLRERGEDIELRQRQRRHPVQPDRVAKPDEVEPPAAPLPSGDRAVLAAQLAEALLVGPDDLRRERPLADARDVRLGDSDHAVDAGRADADPGGGRAGDRVRGRHEGIRAVVEVEQRRLGTLEEHRLAALERVLHEQGRVRDVRAKPLRVALDLLCDLSRSSGAAP